MGTSLSGLTPATTFDGLLKVGDNEPLNTTMKPVGTGDGTDSNLKIATNATQLGNIQFVSSNVITAVSPSTALRITTPNGGVAINSDYSSPAASTMLHIKGSGATSSTTSLLVQNSEGADILKATDDKSVLINNQISVQHRGFGQWLKVLTAGVTSNVSLYGYGIGNASHNWQTQSNYSGSNFRQFNTGFSFGAGALPPDTADTLMTIKGSGNDANTTALLVQNSDGVDMLKVTDDGITTLGTTGQRGQINLKRPSDGVVIGTIQGTSNGLYLTNQDGSNHMLIGTTSTNGVSVGGGTAPTMGARFGIKGSGTTSATTSLLVQNSAGTDMLKVTDDGRLSMVGNGFQSLYNGTWGINHNTNNISYKAFEKHTFQNWTSTGLKTTLIINGSGTNGEVGINNATPTAQLHIKGSGATSATSALLVQNSAGTDLLKVLDDGSVFSNGGGAKLAGNTGFGEGVLASVTTGASHTAFGIGAFQAVTTGVANTGFGWRVGYSTTGSNNAFVGLMAGYTNSSGNNNTGLGTRVLYDNATGSDNTAVGYRADSDGFSGSVILGRDATATANNQFVVGSSGTNAGTITTEAVTSDATWQVVINGTAYKVLLKAV